MENSLKPDYEIDFTVIENLNLNDCLFKDCFRFIYGERGTHSLLLNLLKPVDKDETL